VESSTFKRIKDQLAKAAEEYEENGKIHPEKIGHLGTDFESWILKTQ